MNSTTDEPKQSYTIGTIRCSSPFPKPPPTAYDEIITLTVGKAGDQKLFRVYRGVLCHYSGYFKTMLNGKFKENLILGDTNPDVFQLFYNYINTGDPYFCDVGSPGAYQVRERIVRAYIFADFYLCQGFKNRVLDIYFTNFVTQWVLPLDVADGIYENTPVGDALRKVNVDICVDCWRFSLSNRFELPQDFLMDLMAACRDRKLVPGSQPGLAKGREWFVEKQLAFCETYHDHKEPEERPPIKESKA